LFGPALVSVFTDILTHSIWCELWRVSGKRDTVWCPTTPQHYTRWQPWTISALSLKPVTMTVGNKHVIMKAVQTLFHIKAPTVVDTH